MNPIQQIDGFDTLKILGDARRLTILRLLMSAPATLSQLGRVMEMHPAKVRYHLKQLEGAGFVHLTSTRIVYGFVEKYYQATARAYCVNLS
ncbi:MAG: helix-turn-helix domain-containing protein, partial [Chloroflexota bacterium]